MSPCIRLLSAAVPALMVLASAAAHAGPAGVEAWLEATAGDGDTSYMAGAVLSGGSHWALGAGAGHSRAADAAGTISGVQWDVSAELRATWIGLEARYTRWNDSGSFGSHTPAATLYLEHAALRLEALGEWPRYRIDYQWALPGRTIGRSYAYSASGYGAGVSWAGERWQAYARALDYQQGERMERLAAILRSPELVRFPRLATLLGSVSTLTRGALDYRCAAGVGARFGRYAPHFDWQHVRDAPGGIDADDYAAGLSVSVSDRIDIDIGGGVTRPDGQGARGYGSLGIGIHW